MSQVAYLLLDILAFLSNHLQYKNSGHVFEAHEHFRVHCSQWQHFMHVLCLHLGLSHLQLKVVPWWKRHAAKKAPIWSPVSESRDVNQDHESQGDLPV